MLSAINMPTRYASGVRWPTSSPGHWVAVRLRRLGLLIDLRGVRARTAASGRSPSQDSVDPLVEPVDPLAEPGFHPVDP